MTLTEFYAARLDEAGARAKAAGPTVMDSGGPHSEFRPVSLGEWHVDSDGSITAGQDGVIAVGAYGGPIDEDFATHIVHNDPAAVLADVAAKRKILAAYAAALADEAAGLPMPSARPGLEYAVIALAAAFADHPDYPLKQVP